MFKVVYNECYGGFGLSERAKSWLAEQGLQFEYDDEIPRHHPLLIKCVETLKSEADGDFADLKIKEVEGLYIIREYDGHESVVCPDAIKWIDPSKY